MASIKFIASQARTIFQYKLIVVYDVNIYTNCIDTQRDGFDKVYSEPSWKVNNSLVSQEIPLVLSWRSITVLETAGHMFPP